MPKFLYKKLVRDNIRSWHEKEGHIVNAETLKGKALRDALTDKLHEEADEIAASDSRQNLIEEITDVQQVLDDLVVHEDITKTELDEAKMTKLAKKGGFKAANYIHTVEIPDEEDRWAQYCRDNPGKYPEVMTSALKKTVSDEPKLELGKYRHYKGGIYRVLRLACHTESLDWFVVYESEERKLKNLPSVWIRPYGMFVEYVEIDGKKKLRFEKIDD